MVVIKEPIEFQWDKGNIKKNYNKHRVDEKEAEESFFDKNRAIYKDKFHSGIEKRHILLGKTKKRRLLYIVFTIRNKKLRIISARDISKAKEVKMYDQTT